MSIDTQSIEGALEAPNPRNSRRLFRFGLAGVIAAAFLLVHESELQDPLLLLAGIGVLVLGAYPALEWARKGLAHFPAFEILMLTTIPFYAVPLVSGHTAGFEFNPEATWSAAIAMLAFQICAVGTFVATRGKQAKQSMLTTTLLPDVAIRFAQTGIWLNTVYFYIIGFTQLIPYEFSNALRAVFFGIGTVSLFIATRRWGAGRLMPAEKFGIALNVVIQLIFLFRDLYLITGISVVLLGLIGYISTSRRVPVVVLAVLLPLVAVLHSGKSTMRTLYWDELRPLPTLLELPAFFQTWIEAGMSLKAAENDADASLAGRLFERASLFQMLCLVTENTPETIPYLSGESYIYIPAQLIPSFLWPGKPSSLLSNVLLAIHYRLIDPDTPGNVSIAFGMIAEAYANFSLIGCAVLGVALGYSYKRISVAALGCPQFSALGLLTILLAAWSFQAEQILASWFVSLIQAAVIVIGLPLVFRLFFRPQ